MSTIEDLQAELRVKSNDLNMKMGSMEFGIATRTKDVVLEQIAVMRQETTGHHDALEGRIAAREDQPYSVPLVETFACLSQFTEEPSEYVPSGTNFRRPLRICVKWFTTFGGL